MHALGWGEGEGSGERGLFTTAYALSSRRRFSSLVVSSSVTSCFTRASDLSARSFSCA